jgi:hypothetical protein
MHGLMLWGCASNKGKYGTMLRQPIRGLLAAAGLLLWPASAWATQTHGGFEGLYVHQLAHLFFAFSMALLIFWLRKWRLTISLSWRYIQYAALFLIAWNVDAMASHWLQEQSGLITVQNIAPMDIRITSAEGWQWLIEVYYLTKLDHLLCVPALVFLFLGLRRLLSTALLKNGGGEPAS